MNFELFNGLAHQKKLQVSPKYYFERLVNSVLLELADLTCSTSKFKIRQVVEKVVCSYSWQLWRRKGILGSYQIKVKFCFIVV